MGRLLPKLNKLDTDSARELRSVLQHVYDILAQLEGRATAIESRPVEITAADRQRIARESIGLIGSLAQPLAGETTSDPLLSSVAQAPGTGTVTSVGLSLPVQFNVANSPVISSGTLTVTWSTQTANTVLAGPTGGGAAVPTFRALVAADVPNLDAAKIASGNLADAQNTVKTVKTDDAFTKTVAGAPYVNDGFVTLKDHAGNSVKVMTTT